ncbi:MAG: hypothetical protein JWO52_3776, partial [Gammaproteobacteria bacterium]|nr:hypothetical protein [Gammaproteobacteria bacterium]
GAHVLHRAQAHGVLVLCRLDIEAALLSTRWASNADAALTKWRHLPLMRVLSSEA